MATSTTKVSFRHRVVNGHTADCYAIANVRKGDWPTPWAYITETVEYRDSLGRLRKKGGQRWRLIRCNCTYCNAQVAVLEDDILTRLSHE